VLRGGRRRKYLQVRRTRRQQPVEIGKVEAVFAAGSAIARAIGDVLEMARHAVPHHAEVRAGNLVAGGAPSLGDLRSRMESAWIAGAAEELCWDGSCAAMLPRCWRLR
jgi:hypothetical protein